jgi:hypothetical protein
MSAVAISSLFIDHLLSFPGAIPKVDAVFDRRVGDNLLHTNRAGLNGI